MGLIDIFFKRWVFCSWVILIKLRDDSGVSFEEFEDCIELIAGYFYSVEYVGWVVITISKLAMPVSQVIVHGL